MTIKLTTEKASTIKIECESALQVRKITIRQVARILGLLVSCFPGVMWGPLHYRQLESDKTEALKNSKGNFNEIMQISEAAKKDIAWWVSNIMDSYNVISHGTPHVHLYSDASKTGWGGTCNGTQCGGPWTPTESALHINVLEIKAAFFTLKCFVHKLSNNHVRINIDNTTAVSSINHMGTSHSPLCNQAAAELWAWCIENHIWVSAAHIAGKDNIEADAESRKQTDMSKEWMLDSTLLEQTLKTLNVTPDTDLFATRLNSQCEKFVSYKLEPGALAIDAFTLNWQNINLYAFPPFSVVSAVLQKLQEEKASGVVVLPNWPTQVWFSKAMRMLIQHTVILQKSKSLLKLPSKPAEVHPLSNKLSLLVCHLSGDNYKVRDFHRKLQTPFYHHGEREPKSSTKRTWIGGQSSDSRGLNPISATVTQGINFLAELMSHNIGYSGINTARSALSSVLTVHDCSTFGTHPLVKRFMKGVFENRPSLPRYACTWDVSTVLKFLSSLPNLEEITLKDLSHKVVMLMALLTGQRAQTLHALDTSSMEMTENKITFYITEVLKHTKLGRHQQPIEFVAFEQDPTLCIVSHIKGYLRRTSSAQKRPV
ncbi:uncharacterized protein LOC122961167 [Acropora millepora]|uniref:uncharacterized protein LOC122961167 n=1 Tax=Acropora millepora TaxID=45264 RepID=UPI001CF2C6FF|nr:uncharacterized protein LOC122961167 [Acropora millepora]